MCRSIISNECLLALSAEYCCLGGEESYLILLLRNIRNFREGVSEIEGSRGKALEAIASMFDEFVCVELSDVAMRNPSCQ